MTNNNDELEKINQSFNNQIDSNDHGFSLTKMFKKNGFVNKATKALLMFSLSVGAFGNIANASTTDMLQNQAEIHNVIQNQFDRGEGLVDYDSLDVLTPELLEEVAQNEMTGIWKHHTSGDVVIVSHDGKLNLEDQDLQNNVVNFLKEKGYGFDSSPHAKEFEGQNSNIKVVNLNKDHSKETTNYISPEKHPLLFKFQNEFFAHHEMDHASRTQLDKANIDVKTINKTVFIQNILMKEKASDLNAIMTIAKTNDLNMSDTIQLLDELADMRTEAFHNNFDIGHASQGTLLAFKESLINNPKHFESIKNMTHKEIGEMTADYSFNSFAQLEGKGSVDLITKNDMIKDLETFINNGKVFNEKDSIIYQKMAKITSFDASTAPDSINYEGFINKLHDRMEKKDSTAEEAVMSYRKTRRHERGLNMVALLDGFQDQILDQVKLDDVLNAHTNANDTAIYAMKVEKNAMEKILESESNITVTSKKENTLNLDVRTKQKL